MNTHLIGKLIKKLREEKNYTQQYVAEQLGISQSSYCRVENDISEISVANLLKLINCLESSIEDFLQIESNKSFQNLHVTCIHSEKIDKIINEYALQDELIKSKDKLIESLEIRLKSQQNELEYLKNILK